MAQVARQLFHCHTMALGFGFTHCLMALLELEDLSLAADNRQAKRPARQHYIRDIGEEITCLNDEVCHRQSLPASNHVCGQRWEYAGRRLNSVRLRTA